MDAKKVLDQFLNSGMATGMVAGWLGGGLARRTGLGGLAKIGGMALVGTLAYQAWQRYQQQQAQLPADQRGKGLSSTLGGVLSNLPGLGEFLDTARNDKDAAQAGFGSNALPAPQQNNLGVALLIAMIAAAKADGHVDESESARILGHMDQARLQGDEKSFLVSELAKPLNIDDVVREAKTPELAAQIYTASAIMIADESDAERDYLAKLADRLKLAPAFVDELKREMKTMAAA
jgi:uncharacterized membrane protein YebE (DUF533 family)